MVVIIVGHVSGRFNTRERGRSRSEKETGSSPSPSASIKEKPRANSTHDTHSARLAVAFLAAVNSA
jgi:hypothetical protein